MRCLTQVDLCGYFAQLTAVPDVGMLFNLTDSPHRICVSTSPSSSTIQHGCAS